MKDMKRAERRRLARRLKVRRASYFGDSLKSERQIGKLVHTATLCSCWMCRNPRLVFKGGETIQERRFWQKV